MGTRGLLGFRHRGNRKATYNHYDSYPSGLGKWTVDFIKSLSNEDVQLMLTRLDNLIWVDQNSVPPEDVQERYLAAGFYDLDVSEGTRKDWYCVLHKMQNAKCLPHIKDGTLTHLIDSSKFIDDTLFCEWAYYIDFEKEVLEVHQPGHWERVVRFADLEEGTMKKMQEYEVDDDEDEDESEQTEDDKIGETGVRAADEAESEAAIH